MQLAKKLIQTIRNNRGATAIVVAVSLIILIGFLALAVDIGHLLVGRNELQNAADAAALAGASALYPHLPSNTPTPPDWGAAETEAANWIRRNKSDNVYLEVAEVVSGYWDLRPGTSPDLLSQSITPGLCLTPTGACTPPAVKVTVRRTAGTNSGPVRNWFASVIGVSTSDVSAKAIAISASTGTAKPGALFPFAITKSLADTLSVGSSTTISSADGAWINFDGSNDAGIAITNLDPVSIGDGIYIVPGVKASIYKNVPHKTVLLPVVVGPIVEKTWPQIVGFIGLEITDSSQGGKWVQGTVTTYYTEVVGPIGPRYGAFSPPKLVK
jgi:hypothetical protein